MRDRRPSLSNFRCALCFSFVVIACSTSEGSADDDRDGEGDNDRQGEETDGRQGEETDDRQGDGDNADPAGDPSALTPEPNALSAEPGSNALETGSEEEMPVRVRFEAAVGSEPMACGSEYRSSAGVSFTPADLRLFVQDVALIGSDGRERSVLLDVRAPWQLEQVALLDFEDGSGGCLAGTSALNVEITGRVPAGDYRGIAFSNGVPEDANHADPTRLPPPLQAGTMSWGWLQGYRFVMAEVSASGAAGTSVSQGSALLHLGSTGCSGNPSAGGIACNKPNRNRVRLEEFDPDEDVVIVDVGALFEGIDLRQVTTCHSSGEQCGTLLERVGIDPSDGGALDGQVLYRVARATAAGR